MSNQKRTEKYRRSLKGLVNRMYKGQCIYSKERGHPVPEYSRKEFIDYAIIHPKVIELYEEWVKKDYNTWYRPSVDRLNDDLPYTWDNIQFITWKENNDKSISSKRIRVIQLDLEGNFIKAHESVRAAAKAVNGTHSNISRVCKKVKGFDTCKGFNWEYEIR
jgi:hypothetical protein